jgi:hypothetical protein
MVTRLILFALTVALAGCHTAARYAGDENSPYYVIPSGSHVVLNQALTVAPEEAGVFIQNGEAKRRGQVEFYNPYCRLELKTVRGAPRTVAPDDMIVRKSAQQTLRTYTRIPGEQYAALLLAAEPGDDSSSTLQTFATLMDLDSQNQPEVDRMTCARVGYRGEGLYYPTIAEIRRTLGNIATLRLSGQSG